MTTAVVDTTTSATRCLTRWTRTTAVVDTTTFLLRLLPLLLFVLFQHNTNPLPPFLSLLLPVILPQPLTHPPQRFPRHPSFPALFHPNLSPPRYLPLTVCSFFLSPFPLSRHSRSPPFNSITVLSPVYTILPGRQLFEGGSSVPTLVARSVGSSLDVSDAPPKRSRIST